MRKRKTGKLKKSTSIILLVIVFILMVPAIVFTFFPFQIGLYDNNSVLGSIKLGIDLKGGVYVVLEPELDMDNPTDEDIKKLEEDLDGTIAIMESRLFSKGYPEATVVKQTDFGSASKTRIRIEIPDVKDPQKVFDIIGKQAVLEFMSGVTATPGQTATDGTVEMEGKHVLKARAAYDSNNQPVVALELDKAGTEIFKKLTEATGSEIAIVVDKIVISKPKVEASITDGKPFITNIGDIGKAQDLALQISSGSLPIKFKEISPKVISATLGEKALTLSLIAGGVGILLVFVFMAIFYRGFGLIADLALSIYVLILLFLLAVIPFVQLTLQGIAGIILSIGMAVDANIIVFERIKDEYKNDKNIEASVKSGFQRATIAILDSNITTIIATVVMWIFGTGSIKSFAITLFFGILVSLVTSLLITRLFVKMFLSFTTKDKFYNLKRAEVEENEQV